MLNAWAEWRESEHYSEGEPAEQEGQHDGSDHHGGSKQRERSERVTRDRRTKD